MDDALLVGEILCGKVDAYRDLVDRHAPAVFRIVRSAVRQNADAEDIAQEVFFAAYTNLAQLRDPQRFRPWLLSIAARRCADHLRRRRSARECPLPQETPSRACEHPDEAIASVDALIEAMPAPTRLVLALRHHEGLSCIEIGKLLGKSTVAIYTRLSRAHAELRRSFQLRDREVRDR